jgi:hypothetical protein
MRIIQQASVIAKFAAAAYGYFFAEDLLDCGNQFRIGYTFAFVNTYFSWRNGY